MSDKLSRKFWSIFFSVDDSSVEKTTRFGIAPTKDHEFLVQAFHWWTKLARHVFPSPIDRTSVSVVTHGPKEEGVDILVDVGNDTRFGIAVETNDEIRTRYAHARNHLISDIQRSQKNYDLSGYLIVLCGDQTAQGPRIRNLTADIEKHCNSYGRILPPEKAITIASAYKEMKGLGSRLLKLIDALEKRDKKILVFGDVMLDHVVYCAKKEPPSRTVQSRGINTYYSRGCLPSRKREPKKYSDDETYTPGGAAWAAAALGELAEVRLIGVVGNDWAARELKKSLKKRNVEFIPIVAKGVPTIRKQYVFTVGEARTWEHKLRIDRENIDLMKRAIHGVEERKKRRKLEIEILKKIHENLEWNPDGILIDDYEKGFITPRIVEEVAKWKSSKEGKFLLVDPKYKWDIFAKVENIDIVCCNVREVLFGAGLDEKEVNAREDEHDLPSLKEHFLRLLEMYPREVVAVKADDRGVMLFNRKKGKTIYSFLKVDPLRIQRSDFITGICCGGMFDAILFVGLIKGFELGECVTLANFAGALRCREKLGFPVGLHKIRDEMLNQRPPLPSPEKPVSSL